MEFPFILQLTLKKKNNSKAQPITSQVLRRRRYGRKNKPKRKRKARNIQLPSPAGLSPGTAYQPVEEQPPLSTASKININAVRQLGTGLPKHLCSTAWVGVRFLRVGNDLLPIRITNRKHSSR